MSDPFDWPFPQRRDLMYLSTIKPNESGFRDYKTRAPQDYNLRVDDIKGAQPCLKAYQFTNRGEYTTQIDGAQPRNLVRTFNRMDNQLYNQDIKGTQPQINKFITTRQPSNPLEPLYRIPKVEQREATPPKFIRDNINVNDIEGTQPMPNFQKLRKNIHVFDEIEGSKPKARFQPRDHIEIMDVKDINNYREFKSTRVTNPLNPVYQVYDDSGNKMMIGDVAGSKSRQLHPQITNKIGSQTLNTLDINGAQAGTHAEMFLRSKSRKDFRTINEVQDVPGAKVGSLRKGMQSIRRTNPLQPQYQVPGHTEIYKTESQPILRQTKAQKLDAFLGK